LGYAVNALHEPRATVSYFDESSFEAFVSSLEPGPRRAVTHATEILLPSGLMVFGTKWLKPLTPPLMQFRIGPTLGAVLGVNDLANNQWNRLAPLLVRIFVVFDGPSHIVVLHAYDKTLDRERDSQQAQIAIAQANFLAWMDSREG
jgi:hypothetical protein